MARPSWLRRLFATKPSAPARRPARWRPTLEALEDRTLLNAYTAATVADLINDINLANAAGGTNTITLSAAPSSPYTLTAVDNSSDGATGLPVIAAGDNLTIVGNGDTIGRSTDSTTPAFRLLDVAAGASLTLEGLTLTNGLASGAGVSAQGGAIYSQGALTLNGVSVQNNTAQGVNGADGANGQPGGAGGNGGDAFGGGLYVAGGTATLSNDTLSGNRAQGGNGGNGGNGAPSSGGAGGSAGNGMGGALYVMSGTVILTNDTLSGNRAQGGAGGNGGNGTDGRHIGGNGGTAGNASGGGLDVAGGTATLSNDTLSGNSAQGGAGGGGGGRSLGAGGSGGTGLGGGLYAAQGTVTLSNDTLSGNSAQGGAGGPNLYYGGPGGQGGTGAGGGLYVTQDTATLSNDTLSGNVAQGGGGGDAGELRSNYYAGNGGGGGNGLGGGLYADQGSATLSNDTLSGNSAQGGAGGSAGPFSTNNYYAGNGGNAGSASGGGLYVAGGSATLTNDTLSGNSAQGGGGAAGGSVTGGHNHAGNGGNGGNASGGGLDVAGGSATLSNDTLSGNSAQGGGGGHGGHGDTNEGNGGNGGNASGGGLYIVSGSTVALANTLIAQDTLAAGTRGWAYGLGFGSAGSASGPDVSGSVAPSDHDLVGDGTGSNLTNGVNGDQVGTSASPLNPVLGPLQNNGGPTQTMALLPGSPALDAGSNALLPAGLTTDQRGFARISGAAVDIGAYEKQLPTLSTAPLPDGTYGAAYGQILTATEGGYQGTFSFAVTAGTPPPGMSMTSGVFGLVLTGTPTSAGSFSFTVTATDSAGFSASQSYTLTIDKADLFVTATSNSKTYGQTASDTGTLGGVVNGDGITASFASAGDAASAPVGSGSYAITATLADPSNQLANYTVRETDAILTVNPAALTVTADNQGMPYGGSVPALTYHYSGLVNGDTSASFTGGLTTTATPGSGVGSYPITQGSLTATGNYTIAAFNGGTLTVSPAALTVTADSQSMPYGGSVPALTYHYSGLVNGDTSASFTGGLTTTATPSSGVGSYPIIQGSLAATGNYTIGTFNGGTLSVTAAPLSAAAVNFSATAGAPFSGAVATFTTPDKLDAAAAYTAVITWGDGSTSAGVVTGSNGGFSVSGSHTYAAAGSYAVGVQISNPNTQPATAKDTASVTSLGQGVTSGMTGGIGFWNNNNGQALLDSFSGGPTATALGNWLAATFPNLYGASAGANSLAGKSNAQVAAYFQTLFALGGNKVQAEVLAAALNVYATTSSLGGNAGTAYGFAVSATGLGARSYGVGQDGAAFGVANNSTLSVYQLLAAVNKKAVKGVLYGGNTTLQAQCANLFDALDQAGSIG
jgi:hypothetical protein